MVTWGISTIRDGQDAGELLLDIETRIGELVDKTPPAKPIVTSMGRGTIVAAPSGAPPKHERLGMPRHRMKDAQAIAKHPHLVERVKAKAKENEDIPTRTAVMAEIQLEKKLDPKPPKAPIRR